jgi:site-specific DNA recombinase
MWPALPRPAQNLLCQGHLGRLYAAIESGIADPSDATLKERVAAVKTERDIAQVAFDRAVAEMRPDAPESPPSS